MQFQTQLRRARLTYAAIMASSTSAIMSAISTAMFAPEGTFWDRWPTVLALNLCIAVPVAITLAPLVRRLCHFLYPEIRK